MKVRKLRYAEIDCLKTVSKKEKKNMDKLTNIHLHLNNLILHVFGENT